MNHESIINKFQGANALQPKYITVVVAAHDHPPKWVERHNNELQPKQIMAAVAAAHDRPPQKIDGDIIHVISIGVCIIIFYL